MAGIEDDDGLGVGRARRRFGERDRRARGARLLHLAELGLECRLVGRDEIDDKARRLIVARFEHEGLVDEKRSADIDDDAGLTRREQAVAVRGDQAALLLAEAGRHLKAHIGGVDDDPVGIAEGEDVDVDLLREVGDEAGALAVAGETGVLGDGLLGRVLGLNDPGYRQETKRRGPNRDARNHGTHNLHRSPHAFWSARSSFLAGA